jgi:hypothetical protein
MKLFTLAVLFALSFAPALTHAEDKVQHYNVAEGITAETAKSTLETKLADVEKTLVAEKLDDTAFESIHELSYTLEDAAAKLTGDTKALKDAIEELHLASEDRKEDVVRAALPKIKAELAKI